MDHFMSVYMKGVHSGPSQIGAFGIILSCVVVCETRDKILELSKTSGDDLLKKRPNFYELILMELQRLEAGAAAGAC